MLTRNNLRKVEFFGMLPTIIGGLFKLMHWQGANQFLIVGVGTLVIVNLLLGFTHESEDRTDVWLNYGKHFSTAILLMGGLFHVMHWPNGDVMLQAGGLALAVSLVAALFLKGRK